MKTSYSYLTKQVSGFLLLTFMLFALSTCRTSSEPSSKSTILSSLYNLQEDKIDLTDRRFSPSIKAADLPTVVDLKQKAEHFPPVFDQGGINSCSANVVAAAVYYDMVKQGWRAPFVPSRMFIYYNERKLSGTLDSMQYGNIGAPVTLRSCIQSIHEQGYCNERLWPYDTEKLYIKPPTVAYDSAQHHHTYLYERITDQLDDLKSCLAEGLPFLCGIPVYLSFESASVKQDGKVPMPASKEQKVGGHAILIVGYDEAAKTFTFRNSFGSGWGENGYGTIPFDYILKYGFDFWVLEKVL